MWLIIRSCLRSAVTSDAGAVWASVVTAQCRSNRYLPNYAFLIDLLQSAGRMDEARDYMLMAREIEALGSAGSAVSEVR
jgi:hypothetical protein|tara:strand:+ start:1632 stop:1868 length:237 start_codon:yes stop_codon:yes gene_type:complete